MSNRDYYEEINYTNEVLMRIDKAMFMLKCNMDERRKGESPIFAESLIEDILNEAKWRVDTYALSPYLNSIIAELRCQVWTQ